MSKACSFVNQLTSRGISDGPCVVLVVLKYLFLGHVLVALGRCQELLALQLREKKVAVCAIRDMYRKLSA